MLGAVQSLIAFADVTHAWAGMSRGVRVNMASPVVQRFAADAVRVSPVEAGSAEAKIVGLPNTTVGGPRQRRARQARGEAISLRSSLVPLRQHTDWRAVRPRTWRVCHAVSGRRRHRVTARSWTVAARANRGRPSGENRGTVRVHARTSAARRAPYRGRVGRGFRRINSMGFAC